MTVSFSKGVKDLKISAPTQVGQVNSNIKGKVILVAKYDFLAESKDELCVKKGDVLKLLDRLPHGWVLVEFIDKIASPGLVPSLYVDIAVNDPVHPITLSWLHEVKTNETKSSNTFYDVQVQMLLEKNEPLTINNMPYPLTVSVSNYLTFEDRFWYRVDVNYSTGEQGYHCRYYSDFYNLHLLLLEFINKIDPKEVDLAQLKLPKLPEPVPSQRRNSIEQSDLFSKRCKELSVYMETLMQNKRFKVCTALVNWLSPGYNKLPGFIVDDALNSTNEEINQRILPGSIVLASKPRFSQSPTSVPKKLAEENKYIAPTRGASQKANSKNTYNHYQQAANFKTGVGRSMSTSDGHVSRNGSYLERSRTVSNPGQRREKTANYPTASAPPTPQMHMMHQTPDNSPKFKMMPREVSGSTGDAKFDPNTPNTPKTPNAKYDTPRMSGAQRFNPSSPDYNYKSPVSSKNMQTSPSSKPAAQPDTFVKCKIKTQTNDNVIMRFDTRNIQNHEDFKTMIYQKVAFNNLYVRIPGTESYEEFDSLNSLDGLLSSSKLWLLVT